MIWSLYNIFIYRYALIHSEWKYKEAGKYSADCQVVAKSIEIDRCRFWVFILFLQIHRPRLGARVSGRC